MLFIVCFFLAWMWTYEGRHHFCLFSGRYQTSKEDLPRENIWWLNQWTNAEWIVDEEISKWMVGFKWRNDIIT